MPASLIHLVRHGEVFNPDGVLYGRIPGFGLSELGHRMAAAAAESLAGREISALYASPLQRAQESAAPWSKLFGLDIVTEDRIIEPTNAFEGSVKMGPRVVLAPRSWKYLVNPFAPSWGEAFTSVESRMLAAVGDAYNSVESGEVVMVSHQMPIVMVARSVKGMKLWHDPRKRRCALSSITTLALRDPQGPGQPRFVEVDYQEPARDLAANSIDSGAV